MCDMCFIPVTVGLIWVFLSSPVLEQFVDHCVMYSVAPVSLAVGRGAKALSSLKDQIIAWARVEVPKSPLSRNELARRAGISPASIHRIMGLDDTYTALPKWQNVVSLAKALGVKPPAIPHPEGADGMAEAEAEPLTQTTDSALLEPTPTQSEWRIKSSILAPMGYMPGDHFILDSATPPRNRDCVVAQVVDYDTGTAETVLRVYMDGFLVTPNFLMDGSPRLFVDGKIVQVTGTITRSWRNRPST